MNISGRQEHGRSVGLVRVPVINRLNAQYPLRVYEFLKKTGTTWMQFIPIQERRATDKHELLRLVANDYGSETVVTDESVLSEQWGNFLVQVFDYWVRNDVGRYLSSSLTVRWKLGADTIPPLVCYLARVATDWLWNITVMYILVTILLSKSQSVQGCFAPEWLLMQPKLLKKEK